LTIVIADVADHGSRELGCDNFGLLPWTLAADRVRCWRMPPRSREYVMLGFSQVTRPRIPVAPGRAARAAPGPTGNPAGRGIMRQADA
jgi:hypothetical protein